MNEAPLRKILATLGVEVMHKNARGWLVCNCPLAPFFHDGGTDYSPSCYVKVEEKGISAFNCYTCKNHGNINRLVGMLEHHRAADYNKLQTEVFLAETPSGFGDFVAEDLGAPPLSPVDESIYLRMYPSAWETPSARRYLEGRGIDDETAELHLGLRFDPDEKRIMFPVRDHEGDLFGYTGRTIMPKDEWPQNTRPPYSKVKDYGGLQKRRLLLGEHLAIAGQPFLIVEGLFALAHVISLGCLEYCNPVAVMGSWLGPEQKDILVDWDENAILLFDDDVGGDAGLYGTVDEEGFHKGGGAIDLLKKSVPTSRCIYPEDVHDPDDLNEEQLRNMVTGSAKELAT
jgi:hypothetical protein